MDDLSRFCCQNEQCPDYGKRAAGNLKVQDRYGKGKRLRLLKCRTCQVKFSERKGTVMSGAHLSQEQVLSLAAHQVEGCGVRKTERLTGISKPTVIRYIRSFSRRACAEIRLMGRSTSTSLFGYVVALGLPSLPKRGSSLSPIGQSWRGTRSTR